LVVGFVAVFTASASGQSPATIPKPPYADTAGVLLAFGKRISEESNGKVLLYTLISGQVDPSEVPAAQRRWGERLTRIAADAPGITLMPPRPAVTTLFERLCINDYVRSFHGEYAIRSFTISGDSARIDYAVFHISPPSDSGSFEWGGIHAWYAVRRKSEDWFIVKPKKREWSVVDRVYELFQDGTLNERQPKGYVRRNPSKLEDCVGTK
jgi:hypothetical protein